MSIDWKLCDSAYVHSRQGEIEKAIGILSQLMLEADSDIDRAALVLGQATCYSHVGEIEKSLQLTRSARTLAEGHRDLMSQVALVEASAHALCGEHALACEQFAAIKAEYADLLAQDDDFAVELDSRFACALVEATRYDEAIPMLRSLLKRDLPKDTQRIQLYLGVALAWSGLPNEAQSLYLQAANGSDASLSKTALEYALASKSSQ